MKRSLALIGAGVLALLALSTATTYAWHVEGFVLCANNNSPFANVSVNVIGTSCQGAFGQSATTDSSGHYFIELPDCDGSYTACVDISTLPADATLTTPACEAFSTSDAIPVVTVSWGVNSSVCQPSPPPCTPVNVCIPSNFNGTSIAAGNWVWFNSIIKVTGVNGKAATIVFDSSTVTFGSTTVTIPPAVVTFSPTATMASTTFTGGFWATTVPANYTGNLFLSGTAFQVPSAGLPGGINPVTWCGDFSADTKGLSLHWQWAAAAYTSSCGSLGNLSALGVKPVDANNLSAYMNSDHAGTPESVKACVIGGARGGGGANFTGSYSATASAGLCP